MGEQARATVSAARGFYTKRDGLALRLCDELERLLDVCECGQDGKPYCEEYQRLWHESQAALAAKEAEVERKDAALVSLSFEGDDGPCWCPENWWFLEPDTGAPRHTEDEHSERCLQARDALSSDEQEKP